MLEIKNLHVNAGGKAILQGLDLSLQKGKIHAVMGPNGSGKSTLCRAITGHYDVEITQGEIWFDGKEITHLSPEERAQAGVFMSFQNPVEIPGVNNAYFLRTALNAQRKARGLEPVNAADFLRFMREEAGRLGIQTEMLQRSLNEGFSGGEKKRNEILQMAVLKPSLVLLDEIDSGLDIDALKAVAEGINRLRDASRTFLVITHYKRVLELIHPDAVHVLGNGKIVHTGGWELVEALEDKGYATITGGTT